MIAARTSLQADDRHLVCPRPSQHTTIWQMIPALPGHNDPTCLGRKPSVTHRHPLPQQGHQLSRTSHYGKPPLGQYRSNIPGRLHKVARRDHHNTVAVFTVDIFNDRCPCGPSGVAQTHRDPKRIAQRIIAATASDIDRPAGVIVDIALGQARDIDAQIIITPSGLTAIPPRVLFIRGDRQACGFGREGAMCIGYSFSRGGADRILAPAAQKRGRFARLST